MKKEGSKNIAILLHVFYPTLIKEIACYINRLPFTCDIYMTPSKPEYCARLSKYLDKTHNIILVECSNSGMDIGPFFSALKKMKSLNKAYGYYLKLHSKKDADWSGSMYEACLPKVDYSKLFNLIDSYNVVGSDKYLYDFASSHANKHMILEQITKFDLNITESELYDTVSDFDPEEEPLDKEFYFRYHQDLHTSCLPKYNLSGQLPSFLERHWRKHGKYEAGRVPNPTLVTAKANKHYKFYAGTVFWFNHTYLKYLLEHCDSFEEIEKNLLPEKGKIVNDVPTYTHHLEYWFGLLASHLQQPQALEGIRTITFLIPDFPYTHAPVSGGYRTVLRMIDSLQRQNYIINIEVHCLLWRNFRSVRHTARAQSVRNSIKAYGEIEDVDRLHIYYGNENKSSADLYVATGWQTFVKLLYYQKLNKLVCSFCQDLEYNFRALRLRWRPFFKRKIKSFYNVKLPTFTMSLFLMKALNDGRNIASTSFNVNKEIYFDQAVQRRGICLLFADEKPHRLPSLVLRIAEKLADNYPDKTIYLYGHSKHDVPIKKDNIKSLGVLSLKETADLYNRTELGLCFSTTNPSRVAFEMAACGLPCIEADNHFTEFDLPANTFVKVNTDQNSVLDKIDQLFEDKEQYESYKKACHDFAEENFYKDKEEISFSKFLNEQVLNKKR